MGTVYNPFMVTDDGWTYVFLNIGTGRLLAFELVGWGTKARLAYIDEWAPMEGWATEQEFQAYCTEIAKTHPESCF